MNLRMKQKAKPERPVVCWMEGCPSTDLSIAGDGDTIAVVCNECGARWSVRKTADRWGRTLTVRRSG